MKNRKVLIPTDADAVERTVVKWLWEEVGKAVVKWRCGELDDLAELFEAKPKACEAKPKACEAKPKACAASLAKKLPNNEAIGDFLAPRPAFTEALMTDVSMCAEDGAPQCPACLATDRFTRIISLRSSNEEYRAEHFFCKKCKALLLQGV